MIILGLDCSSTQSSVCIMQENKPIFTAVQEAKVTHSQNLLPMVNSALTICGLGIKDIDLFAVTVGPGSFTGLRIGLALIKGMALAADTPCVGISSLKALAASVDFDGMVVPCFDARRNQLYCAILQGADVIKDDACCLVEDIETFIKNSKKDVFFVGDGSNLCYNKYGNLQNVKSHCVKMPCIAYGACVLSSLQKPATHFELTPSYLRLSQAEQELKERQNDSFSS